MADESRTIGFIGVGTMGFPMAARLLERGFSLVVYDLAEAPLQALSALGARRAPSVQAVGAQCRYVVTSLPMPADVEQVLCGPDGVMDGMQPGGTVIDMSTVDPGTTRRVAAKVAERGLRMLDAPVSGAPPKAREGTLTIMVGGESDVLEDCRPILEALGENVIHVGPIGMGETVKLVNNLMAAINMAGVAEAFNIGVRAGVDPQVLFDVVSKSSGDCWVLRTRVPYPDVIPAAPANQGFAPGFMVDLMLKDVRLAVDAANGLGARAVLGPAIEQLYREAHDGGQGRLDFSAVASVFAPATPPAN